MIYFTGSSRDLETTVYLKAGYVKGNCHSADQCLGERFAHNPQADKDEVRYYELWPDGFTLVSWPRNAAVGQ